MKNKIIFIFKLLILVLLFLWVVVIFVDYFRVKESQEPIFCIYKQTEEYEDGNVVICNGVGYKTITYNRSCLSATEFGSFLIKERTCNNN